MTINDKGRAPGKYATPKTHYAGDSKPHPPYSAKLFKARLNGRVPYKTGFGHLCIVLDWDRAGTAALPRVVVPDGSAYQMGFLAGLDTLVISEAEPHLSGVLHQIMAAFPCSLTVAHMDGDRLLSLEGVC